jgi:hypothetical protein
LAAVLIPLHACATIPSQHVPCNPFDSSIRSRVAYKPDLRVVHEHSFVVDTQDLAFFHDAAKA